MPIKHLMDDFFVSFEYLENRKLFQGKFTSNLDKELKISFYNLIIALITILIISLITFTTAIINSLITSNI